MRVILLIMALAVPSSASAETLLQQALKEMNASTQSSSAPRTRMKNSGMWVGGLVMSGAGGFMLGRGLTMKQETLCVGSFNVAYCEEYGGSKNLLLVSGAALTGVGIWL